MSPFVKFDHDHIASEAGRAAPTRASGWKTLVVRARMERSDLDAKTDRGPPDVDMRWRDSPHCPIPGPLRQAARAPFSPIDDLPSLHAYQES